ncbi:MAG: prolipoprotein diacylglyceryl transferase family protein [Ornithinimicrobium sp.]
MTTIFSARDQGAGIRRLPGPNLRIGPTSVPIFRVLALGGVGLGVLIGIAQSVRLGASPWTALAVGTFGAVGSLLVMIFRAYRGSSDWVWHEHELVVLVVAGAVGIWVGRPLAVLDVTVTALLVILAVGRIGCLLAGCCHGREVKSSGWAVHYGPTHVCGGLPPQLIGVPLAPIQLFESAGALVLAVGAFTIPGLPPGAVLVAGLGARATLRIVLESYRGDRRRPDGLGLSTPQGWAVAMAVCLLLASAASAVPVGAWTAIPLLTGVALVGRLHRS